MVSRPSLPAPLSSATRVLLVIAHPDDETMFFAPTLLQLARSGSRAFIVCLSTGDFYGEGMRRCGELSRAVVHLGVDASDVTVLDLPYLKDGSPWEVSEVVPHVVSFCRVLDVDAVLSFDDLGISGHPNHAACSLALKAARKQLPERVQIVRLSSPSPYRKYYGIFSLPLSFIRDPPSWTVVSSPAGILPVWRAMAAHRSQLLWFRYLYMMTSSLILVNSWTLLDRRRKQKEMYDDSVHIERQNSSMTPPSPVTNDP